MEEGNATSGKLVTRLEELPEGRTFVTPSGYRISRVSATKVKFGENREIDIIDGSVAPSPRIETTSSSKLPTRRRAASQGDSGSSAPANTAPPSKRVSREPSSKLKEEEIEPDHQDTPEKRLGALDLSTGARIVASVRAFATGGPPKAPVASLRPPQLLPGEKELFVCQDIEYVVSETVAHPGTIFLTNYQLLFRSSDARQSIREVSLAPLGKITRIEKVGGKKSSLLHSSLIRQLIIHCKDFHKSIVIRMASANSGQRKQLFELINKRAFPGKMTNLFAFSYSPAWSFPTKSPSPHLNTLLRSDLNIGINGWNLFSFDHEFERIGVFDRLSRSKKDPAWRWTDVNADYSLCKSYPERFVVPHAISDQQLQKVAHFRTQSRVPMLSWIHRNGASISRCSQPKSGLVTSRCAEDELLLSLIRETTESDQYPLVIIDPRPRTNAEANRAVGAGYEKEANYAKTKVHFMGIANIHVVRDSQQQLAALCAQASGRTDSFWLSSVESSGWLKHIKTILAASTLIIKCISQYSASCLVHCSDGWDRTSQVVSLAMLCMDPYYRTISGFCILIEKEWCRAGHMFATRHGHGSKNYGEDSRAPIFLQWIDCVWQIFRQFITSFEFNENFLIRVTEEVCNGRFGTFLADNEAMQRDLDLSSKTVSLWTYIHHKDNFYRFTNPLYSPPLSSSTLGSKTPVVLLPKCSIFALSFWANSYLQSSNFRDRIAEMSMERAFELNCRIEALELHIQELEQENAELKGVPPPTHASSPFGIGLGLELGYGAEVYDRSSELHKSRGKSPKAKSGNGVRQSSDSIEKSSGDDHDSAGGSITDLTGIITSSDLSSPVTRSNSNPISPLSKKSLTRSAFGSNSLSNSEPDVSLLVDGSGTLNGGARSPKSPRSPRSPRTVPSMASSSTGKIDSIVEASETISKGQRSSGDLALDQLVQDLTQVGPKRSQRLYGSSRLNTHTPSSGNSPSDPSQSPDMSDASGATTALRFSSNTHHTISHHPRHSILRGDSPSSSAVAPNPLADGGASPTIFSAIDDDIDWNETLSIDTPRVRGIPQWGSVDMMIEDYAPAERSGDTKHPTIRG